MYLETINSPADIKKLEVSQLRTLADETRAALVNKISKAGGHQGPKRFMAFSHLPPSCRNVRKYVGFQ